MRINIFSDRNMFTHDPAIWLKDLLLTLGIGYRMASILSTGGLVGIILSLSKNKMSN